MADHEQLLITPQTKIGELLKRYPKLEEVLIARAPAFKKLRNPVLRRTVARVTSLAQAARVGGISATDLVRELRRNVGQPEFVDAENKPVAPDYSDEKPDWVEAGEIVRTLDARPMIDSGEQPIGQVLRELAQLEAGQTYELITPFEPAPLIDKAGEKGLRCWTARTSPGEFRTYFAPNG